MADLYALKRTTPPFKKEGERAANIITGLEELNNYLERLLFGLGIRFVGETVSTFGQILYNIDQLMAIKNNWKMSTDSKIAESVVLYFENPENVRLIDRLKIAICLK